MDVRLGWRTVCSMHTYIHVCLFGMKNRYGVCTRTFLKVAAACVMVTTGFSTAESKCRGFEVCLTHGPSKREAEASPTCQSWFQPVLKTRTGYEQSKQTTSACTRHMPLKNYIVCSGWLLLVRRHASKVWIRAKILNRWKLVPPVFLLLKAEPKKPYLSSLGRKFTPSPSEKVGIKSYKAKPNRELPQWNIVERHLGMTLPCCHPPLCAR